MEEKKNQANAAEELEKAMNEETPEERKKKKSGCRYSHTGNRLH